MRCSHIAQLTIPSNPVKVDALMRWWQQQLGPQLGLVLPPPWWTGHQHVLANDPDRAVASMHAFDKVLTTFTTATRLPLSWSTWEMSKMFLQVLVQAEDRWRLDVDGITLPAQTCRCHDVPLLQTLHTNHLRQWLALSKRVNRSYLPATGIIPWASLWASTLEGVSVGMGWHQVDLATETFLTGRT